MRIHLHSLLASGLPGSYPPTLAHPRRARPCPILYFYSIFYFLCAALISFQMAALIGKGYRVGIAQFVALSPRPYCPLLLQQSQSQSPFSR